MCTSVWSIVLNDNTFKSVRISIVIRKKDSDLRIYIDPPITNSNISNPC